MSKVDRRSLFSETEKPEADSPPTPEPAAPPAEASDTDAPQEPLEEANAKVNPLGMDYIKSIVENWPKSSQGRGLVRHLPQALKDMLDAQSPEFALGFANGVQAIHDMCIKVLLDELRGRLMQAQYQNLNRIPADQLLTTQDRLVTVVAANVEGLGYLACKSLVDREKKPDGGSSESN